MNMMLVSVVAQVVMVVIIAIKYFKLRGEKEVIIYCHEKKSFSDTYLWIPILTAFSFFTMVAYFIFNDLSESLSGKIEGVYFTLGKYVLVTVYWIVIMVAISFAIYLCTEIKHLSPEDAIGKKIYAESIQEAIYFFLTGAVLGVLFLFASIAQLLEINRWLGVMSIIACIIVYIAILTNFILYVNLSKNRNHGDV